MRIVSLELNGFRGFPRHHLLDLDAEAVVVCGANGNGKTSLFDAILWTLCGRLPRLNNDDARLVSVYSETGQARVSLRLRDESGREFTITRSFDGQERRVSLETSDGTFQGPSAEGRLIDLVWPDAGAASDPNEALASVLTRSVYLQQDLVRHFVEAATDQERFAAVSELVGAGRVTELQVGLERAKKAWSTATNQRVDELRSVREQLALMQARLAELEGSSSRTPPVVTAEALVNWWHEIRALRLSNVDFEPSSPEAASAIDSAIRQLDAHRRATERRLEALRLVASDLTSLVDQPPSAESSSLPERLAFLRHEIESIKLVIAEEQARLAEQRRLQVALQERTHQLRALAALALKHLDERCPVCAQTYDKEGTRRRLERMARGEVGSPIIEPTPETLPDLLRNLASKEQEANAVEVQLQSIEQAIRRHQLNRENLRSRLRELAVPVADDAKLGPPVASAISAATTLIERISGMLRIGETLGLALAQSSARTTATELQTELDALRRQLAERERAITLRNQTGERAQRVIEALREAASEVVQQRLHDIGPLLQSIYARIDPHPAFRVVSFLSRIVRGRGQLSTIITDPVEEKESDVPAAILSSSQINALAVSVFLALNIGISRPPLSTAILDDPLQTLDDINLLGVVDLLRRTKDRRQLFVSTHDERFGGLLSRKLRPTPEGGRTVVIELNAWGRQGPDVLVREVKGDPVPLRLAEALVG